MDGPSFQWTRGGGNDADGSIHRLSAAFVAWLSDHRTRKREFRAENPNRGIEVNPDNVGVTAPRERVSKRERSKLIDSRHSKNSRTELRERRLRTYHRDDTRGDYAGRDRLLRGDWCGGSGHCASAARSAGNLRHVLHRGCRQDQSRWRFDQQNAPSGTGVSNRSFSSAMDSNSSIRSGTGSRGSFDATQPSRDIPFLIARPDSYSYWRLLN
jgi:hypothetical protein